MSRQIQHPSLMRFSWFLVYACLVAVIGAVFAWITGDKVVMAATLLTVTVLLLVGIAETLRVLELAQALAALERDLTARHTPVQNRFPGQASDVSLRVATGAFSSGALPTSHASGQHPRPLRSVGHTGPQATS